MTKVTSFVAHDTVDEILAELPWGKRSQFINKCILGQCNKVKLNMQQNQNFQTGSNDSAASNEQQKPSTESNKQSKEPETELGGIQSATGLPGFKSTTSLFQPDATATKPTEKSKQNTKRESTLSSLLGEI